MTTAAQLHLFKSKRQRGVQPPPPLEFAIQCVVADLLRRWASPNWIWTHIGHGGERTAMAGARLKRAGVQPGWPDLILLPPGSWHNPRPHFLELKRRGGTLSGDQAAFQLWCMLNNCPFEVANNVKDAVAILSRWGAVRSGINVQ
jgi:hypothetical protein